MPGWHSGFTMTKTLGCAKHLAQVLQVAGRCLGASLTALVSTCFIPGHFIPCSSPDPSITETCREGAALPLATPGSKNHQYWLRGKKKQRLGPRLHRTCPAWPRLQKAENTGNNPTNPRQIHPASHPVGARRLLLTSIPKYSRNHSGELNIA